MSHSSRDKHIQLILTIDPSDKKWVCPLTECNHRSASCPSAISHMWKFNGKNAPNKTCIGQNSNSLTLYPKLFNKYFDNHVAPIFQKEFPYYKWNKIKSSIINPTNNQINPDIFTLITKYNFKITKIFLKHFPNNTIPSNLKYAIIDDPSDLNLNLNLNDNDNDIDIDDTHIDGPPKKKRKIDNNSNNASLLNLPSLNTFTTNHTSSHSNSILDQISSGSTNNSFSINQYRSNNNNNNNSDAIPGTAPPELIINDNNNNNNNKNRKRKRRGIGPTCSSCFRSLNPCSCFISCIECNKLSDGNNNNDNDNDLSSHYDLTNTNNVLICIACFRTGREFNSHKRFHRYIVLDLTDFRLDDINNFCNSKSTFRDKNLRWKCRDEWNLIRGIRLNGLGKNWLSISKIINKSSITKSHDIFTHFNAKFGKIIHKKQQNNNNNKYHSSFSQPPPDIHHTNNKKSNNSKFTEKHRVKCGYRSYRNEFEAEWNNDAESMIGDMYFSKYDNQSEKELKFEGLRLYNCILKKRKIRSKFIYSYGVMCNKKYLLNKKTSSYSLYGNNIEQNNYEIKLEEEINNNLSKFARYSEDKNCNFSEFKLLINGLIEEKRLREEIYKLKHYLLNGCTSINQMNNIQKYCKIQNDIACDDTDHITSDDDRITSPNEYLNKYNGCSLDNISKYLKLIKKEDNKYRRNNNNNNNKKEKELNNNNNMSSSAGYSKLDSGEKKLINILRISAKDYKYISEQISKRVYLHGLLNNGQIKKQLYCDIKDINDIKNNTQFKIGSINPQILDKNIQIKNHKR